jgi:hypothetical protein
LGWNCKKKKIIFQKNRWFAAKKLINSRPDFANFLNQFIENTPYLLHWIVSQKITQKPKNLWLSQEKFIDKNFQKKSFFFLSFSKRVIKLSYAIFQEFFYWFSMGWHHFYDSFLYIIFEQSSGEILKTTVQIRRHKVFIKIMAKK